MFKYLPMRIWIVLSLVCFLQESYAADFPRGSVKVSLPDKWAVSKEPGPELLKANLSDRPTVSLAVWKYNSASMSSDQFLSMVRSDLGWSQISSETRNDARFGRVHSTLFQKISPFDETTLNIHSYDFVLDGNIYVLNMLAPSSEFSSVEPEFRAVFDGLSKSSPTPSSVSSPIPSSPSLPPSSISPSPNLLPPSSALPSSSPSFAFFYELSDGTRLGFDTVKNWVAILNSDGSVKTGYAISGKPYVSPLGLFALSGEYAYRLDPMTGTIVGRDMLSKIFKPVSAPPPPSVSTPPTAGSAVSNIQSISQGPTGNSQSSKGADSVKAVMDRAAGMKQSLDVRHAIEFMMNERPRLEASGSPSLYEFYFRLGEYWEEAGDLETALAYYRLATKAIN